MSIYGRETWLAHGEAFSIAFSILARFAPLEARRVAPTDTVPRLYRPPGAGLMTRAPVSASLMAFVLLMLATVTFDGFQETPLMQRIETKVQARPALASALFRLSEWGLDESQTLQTVVLTLFPLAFLAVYCSHAG